LRGGEEGCEDGGWGGKQEEEPRKLKRLEVGLIDDEEGSLSCRKQPNQRPRSAAEEKLVRHRFLPRAENGTSTPLSLFLQGKGRERRRLRAIARSKSSKSPSCLALEAKLLGARRSKGGTLEGEERDQVRKTRRGLERGPGARGLDGRGRECKHEQEAGVETRLKVSACVPFVSPELVATFT